MFSQATTLVNLSERDKRLKNVERTGNWRIYSSVNNRIKPNKIKSHSFSIVFLFLLNTIEVNLLDRVRSGRLSLKELLKCRYALHFSVK